MMDGLGQEVAHLCKAAGFRSSIEAPGQSGTQTFA